MAALSMIQQMQGAVDVLVTDIKMPRMTGTELVMWVKAEFPSVPVVYISGESAQQSLHDPRARVLFVQKPFGPQAILDAVTTVAAPVHCSGQGC
jgi:two-component system cell cycle sensor histidine kinase/response regulator CckA